MKHFIKQHSSSRTYAFMMLISMELLMSLTFLGYIHIPPISITFAYIPILIAGCFLGPKQSTILGFLFGLISMCKASAYYVMPSDKVFSPFMSGSPIQSILLSIGTRTLFGLLIGLVYKCIRQYVKNKKYRFAGVLLVTFLASKFHALLVYTAMGAFFPELNYSYKSVFTFYINDFLVSLLCIVMVAVLWKLADRKKIRNFRSYIDQPVQNQAGRGSLYRIWATFIAFTLVTAVAASYYFADRMTYMLKVHGLTVSADINHDLLLLQIQFLIAAFSLNLVMAISLMIIYKYLSYKEYLVEMDALTGIMGRKLFLETCEAVIGRKNESAEQSCFIFVDVDYFKSINDTYGHLAGDNVLREIASELQKKFRDCGKTGRLGGDEFAIVLEHAPSQEILSENLDRFLSDIANLLPEPAKVSCSIGALYFTAPKELQAVYSEADKLLYAAKEQGRACYVIK